MKKLGLILFTAMISLSLQAQTEQTQTVPIDSVYNTKSITYPKHEIGFSVGVFPIIGIGEPGGFIFVHEPFKHRESTSDKYGYSTATLYGSYTVSYNYHFNRISSLGVSFSWAGRYIDEFQVYEEDTIDGKGWKHYFTLQLNYRCTYYRTDDISLYCGLYAGVMLGRVDEAIRPKQNHSLFFSEVKNHKYFSNPAFHFTLFGVEFGKTQVFLLELGIGTQGVLQTGFRYKF